MSQEVIIDYWIEKAEEDLASARDNPFPPRDEEHFLIEDIDSLPFDGGWLRWILTEARGAFAAFRHIRRHGSRTATHGIVPGAP